MVSYSPGAENRVQENRVTLEHKNRVTGRRRYWVFGADRKYRREARLPLYKCCPEEFTRLDFRATLHSTPHTCL